MALGKLPEDESSGDGVFAEINITPLTDIFLVLLIIFMVTSSVIVQSGTSGHSGVHVTLPKGSRSDVQTAEPDSLAVAILADGRTIIGGKVVSDDELKSRFATADAHNPETTVVVQADAGVLHGKVVAVMEMARAAGLERLAIATQSTP
ncbi:MAG: ExbD/TolR family protein [Deltaproteobacteria bacterium]